MATPQSHRVTKIPGKLCKDPTDLSAAFPHGGTALGLVRDGEYQFGHTYFEVEAEEFGGPYKAHQTGLRGVFSCVARQFDNDFLSAMFIDAATGGATGRTILSGDAGDDTQRAGVALDSLECALYFAPDDPLQHGILLYRAVPMIGPAAKINAGLDPEVGILTLWLALPDATKRTHDIGPISDLTL